MRMVDSTLPSDVSGSLLLRIASEGWTPRRSVGSTIHFTNSTPTEVIASTLRSYYRVDVTLWREVHALKQLHESRIRMKSIKHRVDFRLGIPDARSSTPLSSHVKASSFRQRLTLKAFANSSPGFASTL